tara:strand:+ start:48778 stop:50136 length:1359 start_codon:yes stop_codon:yes gene_type:complete
VANSILIVDDDEDLCELLALGLQQRGFEALSAHSSAEALELLREREFDAAMCDVHLGEDDGLELCQSLTSAYPSMLLIIMTGQGNMEIAIGAIRAGAYDFLPKPIKLDSVVLVLERALELARLRKEVKRLRSQELPRNLKIVGESDAMQKVFTRIGQLGQGDATALITGESGTGKELVANSIHAQSKRSDGPFVAINCAAMTPSLLESELFGHVRGAFTGAQKDRDGLFVQASGGTLFLDEVGEMPLEMQVKLLRVLQENQVRPVGGNKVVPFDTRIVTATNRDLETEVEEGRFREDLFYRINVVRVQIPPLRARGRDVLILAQYFLKKQAESAEKQVVGISSEAAQKLLAYEWPGNVRELENAMEHAVTLTLHDQIVPDDLPERITSYESTKMVVDVSNPDELPTLEEVEKRYLRKVLAATAGNKTRAAEILGVNRRTMYRKMERLEISDP